MKHKLCTLLSAVMLCGLCVAPAHALEYSFDAPDGGYPAVSTPVDNSGYPTVDTGGASGQAVAFTEVTSAMYYSNGSLGTLKIPSIGLTVGVYEGTGDAPLLKGAGHFTSTSIWAGNICIAGHNRGVRNDFGKIHLLKSGDIITFTTALAPAPTPCPA